MSTISILGLDFNTSVIIVYIFIHFTVNFSFIQRNGGIDAIRKEIVPQTDSEDLKIESSPTLREKCDNTDNCKDYNVKKIDNDCDTNLVEKVDKLITAS